MPSYEALEILKSRDVEIVPVDDGLQQLGVFRHNESGEIELSLADQPRLLDQFMEGEANVQPMQVQILGRSAE